MVCNKDVRNRLRRAEGQMRGVIKMLDEGVACKDVLTQLMAVRTSVDRVISLVAVDNLLQCMDSSERDEKEVQEAVDMLVKYR